MVGSTATTLAFPRPAPTQLSRQISGYLIRRGQHIPINSLVKYYTQSKGALQLWLWARRQKVRFPSWKLGISQQSADSSSKNENRAFGLRSSFWRDGSR